MKKLLSYSVVLFVLTVVLLLIIPLPAALVDVEKGRLAQVSLVRLP